jgi:hypothetical protein
MFVGIGAMLDERRWHWSSVFWLRGKNEVVYSHLLLVVVKMGQINRKGLSLSNCISLYIKAYVIKDGCRA